MRIAKCIQLAAYTIPENCDFGVLFFQPTISVVTGRTTVLCSDVFPFIDLSK